MIEKTKIEEFSTHLKNYVGTSLELMKLETIERTTTVGSIMVSGFVIGFAAVFFLLFFSLSMGFYLSACFGDTYSGFASVAAFYFLLVLVLYLARKKLIQKPLRNRLISMFLSTN